MRDSDYQIDVIGDIHGYGAKLKVLLAELGYALRNGVYAHSERQALFIGDYIDRGPDNFEVVDIVRSMVDAGSAYALMGNHEYNALCFHTSDPAEEGYLRPHNAQNIKSHKTFLDEYERNPEKGKSILEWFASLPMALQIGHGCFVHACWDHACLSSLSELVGSELIMTNDLLVRSSVFNSHEFSLIKRLLKGPDIYLQPYKASYLDQEGVRRRKTRTAWWKGRVTGLRDVVASVPDVTELPDIHLTDVPDHPIIPEGEVCFFGHYWMIGQPKCLTPNIACVDYSVAKDGYLTCYRWGGERELDNNRFVYI